MDFTYLHKHWFGHWVQTEREKNTRFLGPHWFDVFPFETQSFYCFYSNTDDVFCKVNSTLPSKSISGKFLHGLLMEFGKLGFYQPFKLTVSIAILFCLGSLQGNAWSCVWSCVSCALSTLDKRSVAFLTSERFWSFSPKYVHVYSTPMNHSPNPKQCPFTIWSSLLMLDVDKLPLSLL